MKPLRMLIHKIRELVYSVSYTIYGKSDYIAAGMLPTGKLHLTFALRLFPKRVCAQNVSEARGAIIITHVVSYYNYYHRTN